MIRQTRRKPASKKIRTPRKESVPVDFIQADGSRRTFMATRRVRAKTEKEVVRRVIEGQKKIGRTISRNNPFVEVAVMRWREAQ